MIVIVTGASEGIGKACAMEFARAGYEVVISSRNKEKLSLAQTEIRGETGKEILAVIADVSKKEDIENLIHTTLIKFGRIDIMINNTGGPSPGELEEVTEEGFQNGFNELLLSIFRTTKLIVPSMKKNKFGRIINITSLSVREPIPRLLLSNTFRPAIAGFSKSVSNELAQFGITINNIMPGTIKTIRHEERVIDLEKSNNMAKKQVTFQMEQEIPAKKIGSTVDIANLAIFLASEKASYITGTCIQVDGGRLKGI
jgi:3-oxoacyl-[acyl-carrier protein] reductase